LIAAGQRRDEPLLLVAWTQGGVGLLVAGKPPRLARGPAAETIASLVLSHRSRGRRAAIEIVPAGRRRPSLAAHVAGDRAGLAADFDFRLPAGAGPSAGGPALDIRVRASPGGVRTVLGARAELSPLASSETGWRDPQKTASSRSWLEAVMPLPPEVAGGVDAVFRGELRRTAGQDRHRLHLELRTPLSRAAADWMAEGGLLLRLRLLWSLPVGLGLEAGAAGWSGPVAETGATADLPAVPEHGLGPLLSRPGQAAALLINWQRGSVRVKLGVSARQTHHASPESRVAARVDLALPGAESR
jgi:hypothetical protein